MDRGGFFFDPPRFCTFSVSSRVAHGGDAGWAQLTPSPLAAKAGDRGHRAGSSRRTPSRDGGQQKTPQGHSWGRASLHPVVPAAASEGSVLSSWGSRLRARPRANAPASRAAVSPPSPYEPPSCVKTPPWLRFRPRSLPCTTVHRSDLEENTRPFQDFHMRTKALGKTAGLRSSVREQISRAESSRALPEATRC